MELPKFYDEYAGKVYAFFYIKCFDRMTAEDLTSQTFTIFVEQVAEKNIKDLKKYLYGIMRNVWIVFLQDKYKNASANFEDIENFERYVDESVAGFESASLSVKIIPYVDKLPARQKEVLTMRIINDMSTSEVAESLGKDKNYVKTTLHRAINNLREIIENPYEKGVV